MAEVNNDFNPTSYFTDVFSFLPDEGESPVNHINVTIPIIDDKLAEHPESFVVTLELRAQYGSGVRIVQHSSFINISGSDG